MFSDHQYLIAFSGPKLTQAGPQNMFFARTGDSQPQW
jgi:hypothetical protein